MSGHGWSAKHAAIILGVERGERRDGGRARTGLAGKDVASYERVISDMSWVRTQSWQS